MNKRIKIKIQITSHSKDSACLVLIILVGLFLALLVLKPQHADAAVLEERDDSGLYLLRKYYLTPTKYDGVGTSMACTDGYHMASLWEILDLSNLKYNPVLGLTSPDSGQGPPTQDSAAWVRTGYQSAGALSDGKGRANCHAWSSAESYEWGSYILLSNYWNVDRIFDAWRPLIGACNNQFRVWCVADQVYYQVFMPQVVRE